jgi:hypothetical protein
MPDQGTFNSISNPLSHPYQYSKVQTHLYSEMQSSLRPQVKKKSCKMKDDEAFELTYRDTKKKTDFRVNERDTQTRHNNKKTRLA